MYAVLLPPMFPEDAGRYQLLGVFSTEAEAHAFCHEQAEKSKGFYGPRSFSVFKAVKPPASNN